ncbi:MAG: hypothetical protein QOG16_899 [Actinomycetota bacterium]|jgi:hypothetical protein|nr:hypothetical protein [Actinomycetota bacterium]
MSKVWLVACILVLAGPHQQAHASQWFIPPVDGAIARRFEPPGTEWGPGHRGIDYAVSSGTAVRAIGDGTVSFAGDVAGTLAVTISHGEGLESTYSDLSAIDVAEGDVVDQGFWIGRSGSAHGADGLHLGVKLAGAYVDPEGYIGPQDLSSAIRLAPLVWEPPLSLPETFRVPFLSAEEQPHCEPIASEEAGEQNKNIAVLVAGIGSKTMGGVSAALYEAGGDLLGYPASRTYPFSYRGHQDPSLHRPYAREDTFGDITQAAEKLRDLLEAIAGRHPGDHVDLIAHSQGGIVARAYLELAAGTWDPRLPLVDHLVTFSSPHKGAPLAGARKDLDRTLAGHAALRAASWWSRHSGPVPDPYSSAVGQLAPGSDLLERLDREAVAFGTRVLTLAIPNDLVVPADRAGWTPYPSDVVAPGGLNGHDAIVTAEPAIASARRFLRDGPAVCRDGWDVWGPRAGHLITMTERATPWLYRALMSR